LSLGCLYRFCVTVEDLLLQHASTGQKLYYYSSSNDRFRANSICLCCCYACLYLNRTPEEACRPFLLVRPPFAPFRDASYGPSTFNLSLLDVVKGIYKAFKVKILDFKGLLLLF
jgi:cell division cycle 14